MRCVILALQVLQGAGDGAQECGNVVDLDLFGGGGSERVGDQVFGLGVDGCFGMVQDALGGHAERVAAG